MAGYPFSDFGIPVATYRFTPVSFAGRKIHSAVYPHLYSTAYILYTNSNYLVYELEVLMVARLGIYPSVFRLVELNYEVRT